MHQKNLIGLLGGMGPAATVDFLSKVISFTPANFDQDHIPLIVHDVPQIPDRSTAIEAGKDDPFLPMLSGIRLLDAAGVDYIAIPCNTAHYWYERLQKGCRAEILHIADAVVQHLIDTQGRVGSIAVMATRGTIAAGIYSDRLLKATDRVIIPDEETQRLIDNAIASVKAGKLTVARNQAVEAANNLTTIGAACLLLACTELPVVLGDLAGGPVIADATEALARACVKASIGTPPLAMVG